MLFRKNTLKKHPHSCNYANWRRCIQVVDFETNDAETWLLRKWKRCWKRGDVNIQRKSLSCRWLLTRRNVLLKRLLSCMAWIDVLCAVCSSYSTARYCTVKMCLCHGIIHVCHGMSWYVMVCHGMSWYVMVCQYVSTLWTMDDYGYIVPAEVRNHMHYAKTYEPKLRHICWSRLSKL